MLRGINVSGHNLIKMEDLRASLAALGLDGVRTYIQSGNIVLKRPGSLRTRSQNRSPPKFRTTSGLRFPW